MFNNRSILISGGTGSSGSMIKFILSNYRPKRLICFSRDELKQFNLSKELIEKNSCLRFSGDVRDFDRLNLAMKNVDFVMHAAALKHVAARNIIHSSV